MTPQALADAQLQGQQELDRARQQAAAQSAAAQKRLAEQQASYSMTIAAMREVRFYLKST
jgi:hypothetical protein